MERNYAYPAKNRGRDEWMSFLPRSFDIPSETSGLYLPGTQNLELAGYLAKGARPGLLFGAEHDDARFPIVQENAHGIRVVRTVLDAVDAIEAERLPLLTFVHLDFDGNYDTYVDDILRIFRVFPNERAGYFAVTSYAARDAKALRQAMCNVSKFYSGLADRVRFHTEFGRMLERHDAVRKLLGAHMEPQRHLARELGYLWWMVLVMGITSRNGNGLGCYDQAFLHSIKRPLKRITKRVEGLLDAATYMPVTLDEELHELLQDRSCQLWPTDFRRVAYYSASQYSQPMRTWMLRIIPVPDGTTVPPTVQEVLTQVWELAARAPLRYVSELGEVKIF